MEAELITFTKIWVSVAASLCYCHAAGKLTRPGPTRLLAILPAVVLFVLLPLALSSVVLGGLTSFFVSWLATFKLLLFASGRGPLSSLPLRRFLPLACFPIKIKHNDTDPPKRHGLWRSYSVKLLIYSTNLWVYQIRDQIHPKLFMFLFSIYTYIAFETILAVTARLARAWLGVELEPQFDEPYLSTSLQDFWGRRWNLVASNILRPTVYDPVRAISRRWIRREWAPVPAVIATFLVSGLMHELVFFHLGRKAPTWDVTCFFVLHGVCVAVEMAVKRAVRDAWELPAVVSGVLATAFVMATGLWLFWPALMRFDADGRGNRELVAVIGFVRNLGLAVFDFGREKVESFRS